MRILGSSRRWASRVQQLSTAFLVVAASVFGIGPGTDAAFAATVLSVMSGNWSNPAIWSTGSVPGAADAVTITSGTVVTFDVGSATISQLTVLSGGFLVTMNGTNGSFGSSGGNVASISLTVTNDVTVAGTIKAGDGGRGGDQAATPLSGSASALGGNGGTGGSLSITSSSGDVSLVGGRIIIGSGGAGGSATAVGGNGTTGSPGGNATAIGGTGGIGGSLTLASAAGDLTIPSVAGVINGGNGGDGGSASASGGRGGDSSGGAPGPGGSTTERGGTGGSTGTVSINSGTVNGLPTVVNARAFLKTVLAGGAGGEPGEATGTVGLNGAAPPGPNSTPPAVNGPNDTQGPTNGADGWLFPTNGRAAKAAGGAGIRAGKGGTATATGGKGGDALLVGFQIGGVNLGTALPDDITHGGSATASGGPAGPEGGGGGDAIATGGNAGAFPGAIPAILAGEGGSAFARGADGATGNTCCNPPAQGQPGGKGGDATAIGGNSNNFAIGPAIPGGSVTTKPGNGGNGGDGNPPGVRGVRGSRTHTPGTGTPNGTDNQLLSSDGQDGNPCPQVPAASLGAILVFAVAVVVLGRRRILTMQRAARPVL